ncbi:MAG: hypothetical protein JNJ61_11195 [Anaerolineae bacterium]|nr:hypothetical protein [Anaerolineae bacterium]
MNRSLRVVMFAACAFQAFFAAAFALQWPIALEIWPLPYTNQMSFIFIGSIFAAAAVSTFWCVAAREYGALAGIAVDYLAIFTPMGIFAFQLASRSSGALASKQWLFAVACLIGVIAGAVMLWWSRRIPIRDTRSVPKVIRVTFIVLVIALIGAGGLLTTMQPNILPWTITGAGSVVYGWIFFGAAAYFAYSVVRPHWGDSIGQLLGFLAYDLVLIIPFVNLFPTIKPELRFSLYFYTGVVVFTMLLSIAYVFINPRTHIVRQAS